MSVYLFKKCVHLCIHILFSLSSICFYYVFHSVSSCLSYHFYKAYFLFNVWNSSHFSHIFSFFPQDHIGTTIGTTMSFCYEINNYIMITAPVIYTLINVIVQKKKKNMKSVLLLNLFITCIFRH